MTIVSFQLTIIIVHSDATEHIGNNKRGFICIICLNYSRTDDIYWILFKMR